MNKSSKSLKRCLVALALTALSCAASEPSATSQQPQSQITPPARRPSLAYPVRENGWLDRMKPGVTPSMQAKYYLDGVQCRVDFVRGGAGAYCRVCVGIDGQISQSCWKQQ